MQIQPILALNQPILPQFWHSAPSFANPGSGPDYPRKNQETGVKMLTPWKYYLNCIQKCNNGANSLCWCWCKVKQSNLLNNWVYEHAFIHLKAKLSENTVKWPKSCQNLTFWPPSASFWTHFWLNLFWFNRGLLVSYICSIKHIN